MFNDIDIKNYLKLFQICVAHILNESTNVEYYFIFNSFFSIFKIYSKYK